MSKVIQEILPPMTRSAHYRPITTESDRAPLANLSGALSNLTEALRVITPGQTMKITTSVEISTPRLQAPQPRLEPVSVQPAPIARNTVLRVLRLACYRSELGDCAWNYNPSVRKYADGTTMVILLDPTTGFEHGWTVCPVTLTPKYLGWVNR